MIDAPVRVRIFCSKPARGNPETLAPRSARRDRLQVFVDALLREIERVGDGCHRFEANEAVWFQRPDNGSAIVGPELHVDALRLADDAHRGAALGVAHQIAEAVVDVVVAERDATGVWRAD